MPKFKVTVTEKLIRTVLVEANDSCEAEEKAEAEYNNENIVLDYRDFDGVEFNAEKINNS